MNIKDFLIDNYIYILIVIGLIIITIIGFLADKKNKKGGSNKDIAPSNNANMGNVNYNNNMASQGQPMNYQPIMNDNNNQPINNTLLNNNVQQPVNFNQMPNNVINPVNNALSNDNVNMNMGQVSNNSLNNDSLNMNNNNDGNLNVLPGTMQGSIITSNNSNPVNVQPVENILQQPIIPQSISSVQPVVPQAVELLNADNSNVSDAMYQPLLEQTPVLGPTDVNANIQNYNQGLSMNSMNNYGQVNVDNNSIGTVPMDVNNGVVMNNNISNNGFVANNLNNVTNTIPNSNPVVIPNPTMPQQPVTPIPPVINTPPVAIPNQPVGNVTTPQPVNANSLNFVYGQQPTNPNNNGFMQ